MKILIALLALMSIPIATADAGGWGWGGFRSRVVVRTWGHGHYGGYGHVRAPFVNVSWGGGCGVCGSRHHAAHACGHHAGHSGCGHAHHGHGPCQVCARNEAERNILEAFRSNSGNIIIDEQQKRLREALQPPEPPATTSSQINEASYEGRSWKQIVLRR